MNTPPIWECADLFCGAGGSSQGIRQAAQKQGARLKLIAINHWDLAIQTHSRNHPEATHLCAPLDTVNPAIYVPSRRLSLLVASPECFPDGTLILTADGLKPIQEIIPGTLVLTHNNRWRRVTRVTQSISDTVVVKGHGHYGLETTAEHPFLAVERIGKPYERKYSSEKWQPALCMNGHYWSTPTQYQELPVPEVGGRGVEFNEDFWWMIGRWLGDGSLRLREPHSEVHLACGFHEVEALRARLGAHPPTSARANRGEYRWRVHKTRTAAVLECAHKGLAEWLLAHFGKNAAGKTVPAWALTMRREWRQALLDGYLSADGSFNGRQYLAVTVSKRLALGIRLLGESLGYRVAMHLYAARGNPIEGRVIKDKPQYYLGFVGERKRDHCLEEDGHSWLRVRSVSKGRNDVPVYNLSVEEDESYVAEGVVVHNCTNHSKARGGMPINDQSRASAWLVLRWLSEIYCERVIIENVPEFVDWSPLGADGKPLKSKKGQVFQQYIESIRQLGYAVEYRVLNAANYGVPQTRERLFILASRGRRKITWPEPTHSPTGGRTLFGAVKPWKPAREIIDWTIKGQSIFTRKKPLRRNTLARIAAGLRKFSGLPFITHTNHGAGDTRTNGLDKPAPAVTSVDGMGFVEPFLVMLYGTGEARDVDKPTPSVTAQGNHIGVAEPFLLSIRGGKDGYTRGKRVDEPAPTVTGHNPTALVEPFIVGVGGSEYAAKPRSSKEPLDTVTPTNRQGVVEPFVYPLKSAAGKMDQGGSNRDRLHSLQKPLTTVTGADAYALVEPFLVEFHGAFPGREERVRSVDKPLSTVGGSHTAGLVEPYLVNYNGTGTAHSVEEPIDTVTGKDRFALVEPVLVEYAPGKRGIYLPELNAVLDILFRMMTSRELARAQSFRDDYAFAGKREAVVKQIGNAIPPDLFEALVTEAMTW